MESKKQSESESPLRYDLYYRNVDEKRSDCSRFRVRLSTYIYNNLHEMHVRIGLLISQELGVHIRQTWHDFQEFIYKSSIEDVLASVTIIYCFLDHRIRRCSGDYERRDAYNMCVNYVSFVDRAFREQSLKYQIDFKTGAVRQFIDVEFNKNRERLYKIIDDLPQSVAAHLDSAFENILNIKSNTGHAIKDIHFAMEEYVKIIFPDLKGSSLDAKTTNRIRDRFLLLATDNAERECTRELVSAIGKWVDCAHKYRHAPGLEEPSAPPIELAVCVVSIGASFVRLIRDYELKRENGRP